MKKVLITFLLLLPLTTTANTVIAKERAPSEGLYIVGPDISADSTGYLILYYSPDGGHTLEVRNVLDWIDMNWPGLAVDFVDTVIYFHDYRGLYRSIDSAYSFAFVRSGTGGHHIRSGTIPGFVITGGGVISYDYGDDWMIPSYSGWYGTEPIYPGAELGVADGAGYSFNHAGILFQTSDYFESLHTVYDFGCEIKLFRGLQMGEIYAQRDDTIFFSTDFGNSFESVGVAPPYTIAIRHFVYSEIIAGNYSNELYAAGYYRHYIESEYRYKGGSIEIWHSTDQGTTWEMIRHYDASIREGSTVANNESLHFIRMGSQIISDDVTQLYNIE